MKSLLDKLHKYCTNNSLAANVKYEAYPSGRTSERIVLETTFNNDQMRGLLGIMDSRFGTTFKESIMVQLEGMKLGDCKGLVHSSSKYNTWVSLNMLVGEKNIKLELLAGKDRY